MAKFLEKLDNPMMYGISLTLFLVPLAILFLVLLQKLAGVGQPQQ